jgi:GNAT superfamily N-acetyltransferase
MLHNDVLYVHPDYRKSRLGLSLIKATESLAKSKGAQVVLWHAKPNTSLDTLMPRLGYGVQDIIYLKEI